MKIPPEFLLTIACSHIVAMVVGALVANVIRRRKAIQPFPTVPPPSHDTDDDSDTEGPIIFTPTASQDSDTGSGILDDPGPPISENQNHESASSPIQNNPTNSNLDAPNKSPSPSLKSGGRREQRVESESKR